MMRKRIQITYLHEGFGTGMAAEGLLLVYLGPRTGAIFTTPPLRFGELIRKLHRPNGMRHYP